MNMKKNKIITGFTILLIIGLGFAGNPVHAKESKWELEEAKNLGEPFNSPFNDFEITYSADGKQAFFASNRPGGYGFSDVWTSVYTDGKWQEAVNLGPGINRPESLDLEPQISRDGKTLYFTSYNRNGGWGSGDLYVSRMVDGVWQDAMNWNDDPELPHINQAGEDHCPIFANENLIYFSSDRHGTYGGSDIWYVKKVNGVWQEPVNLGPEVNTPSRDHQHWTGLSPDGNSLLVVSNRPDRGSYGGSDIWITTKGKDGNWGPVENLGTLINTNADEVCWTFDPTRKIFHGSSNKDGGLGGSDFYWIFTRDIPLLEPFHGHGYHP